MQACEKRGIIELFGPDAGNGLTGKPAPFVVGVKNLVVAAFDFDDQPELLGELKLVSIVLRSAVDKIADVDGTGLHPRAEAACTEQTNSGIADKSIWAFGPQAAHAGSRRSL